MYNENQQAEKIINSNTCNIGKIYKHGANGGITLLLSHPSTPKILEAE